MEEVINPLSDKAIKNMIRTAQALIGRSTIALEREFPRSKRKHTSSNTYIIEYKETSITWIPNFFNICDMSMIQFNHAIDSENCCTFCNNTMKVLKPNVWEDEDTTIQFYTEASGQGVFLFTWRHPFILK